MWRPDEHQKALVAWSARTIHAAQRELARRRRGEYAKILAEVREADPRPGAEASDADAA